MKSLIVNNVSKSYKRKSALKDISFEVEKGELFGVIGPDGAGKSTLFRIMTTLILADKGEVKIEGYDVVKDYKKIRNIVGYMPGRFSLYQDLTVRENIEFFAAVFNTTVEENYHLVKDIYSQIEPFEKRKAGALSGGMKQKLALSCALIHKPEVLFLDEPTTGVDPISRKEFWNMLKNLQEKGITIIVSTPYMDEATLCNRIALINEGEFMDINTPQELIRKFPKKLYSLNSDNLLNLMNILREDPNVETSFSFGHSIHVTLNDETKHNGYQEIEPSIEDYFMRLSKPQN
jgi:ABC-type multidrug transport system ATPase subunit